MFGFSLGKCVFKTINVSLEKSDKPVSIVWVHWNNSGKFIKIRSLRVNLEEFL